MADPQNAQPAHFDWGIANVTVPVPPSRQDIPVVPPSLFDCKFDPVGAYNVRRHLGVQTPWFNRLRQQFFASDIAFLAAGASEDGRHIAPADSFFPEFFDLHDSQPAGKPGQISRKEWGDKTRSLIFDLATKYDRATAGTTFIVHVKGTTVPGAPLVPERLKAEVYLPPHFLIDHPEVHTTIAFLVQTVIEQIGIPTVMDWRRKAEKIWSLTQRGFVYSVSLPRVLIPAPINARSAQYIFPGRPWGHLALSVPSVGVTLPGIGPVNNDDLALFDIDELTADDDTLSQAVTRVEELQAENKNLRETINSLQALNTSMRSDFETRERNLNAEMEIMTTAQVQLENQIRLSRVSFSSSQRAPQTPTRRGPPTYVATSLARVASPATPFTVGQFSPRGTPSAGDRVAPTLPHTDDILEYHGLMQLRDAIVLIMEYVSVVNWRTELVRLTELPAALVEGVLSAMDDDRQQ